MIELSDELWLEIEITEVDSHNEITTFKNLVSISEEFLDFYNSISDSIDLENVTDLNDLFKSVVDYRKQVLDKEDEYIFDTFSGTETYTADQVFFTGKFYRVFDVVTSPLILSNGLHLYPNVDSIVPILNDSKYVTLELESFFEEQKT
jgi:hypothetical protein